MYTAHVQSQFDRLIENITLSNYVGACYGVAAAVAVEIAVYVQSPQKESVKLSPQWAIDCPIQV